MTRRRFLATANPEVRTEAPAAPSAGSHRRLSCPVESSDTVRGLAREAVERGAVGGPSPTRRSGSDGAVRCRRTSGSAIIQRAHWPMAREWGTNVVSTIEKLNRPSGEDRSRPPSLSWPDDVLVRLTTQNRDRAGPAQSRADRRGGTQGRLPGVPFPGAWDRAQGTARDDGQPRMTAHRRPQGRPDRPACSVWTRAEVHGLEVGPGSRTPSARYTDQISHTLFGRRSGPRFRARGRAVEDPSRTGLRQRLGGAVSWPAAIAARVRGAARAARRRLNW